MSASAELSPGPSPMLLAALSMAEECGLPVFPCRASDQAINGKVYKAKSPLTLRGFKDATRNLDQITQWWTTWPDALIGVPTGKTSGLFVVDVDPHGLEWFADHSAELGAGRIHHTRRGRHLLYRACGLGNSSSTLADGVDTRGDGGYIIWWPASGLSVVGGLEDVGEMPAWILRALQKSSPLDFSSQDASRSTARLDSAPAGEVFGADRSRHLMCVVGRDVRAGLTDGAIIAKHRDHPHAKDQTDPERAVRRCIEKARRDPVKGDQHRGPLDVRDFYSYMPMHQYIFVPSRELWPASSVNARCAPPLHDDGTPAMKRVPRKGKDGSTRFEEVPMTPAEYVDQFRPVDQMTWAPGSPLVVRDRLVLNGGWIERHGVACFNQYRPPTEIDGDPAQAAAWVEHVHRVYGDDAAHIIAWLAHRAQRPFEKINHAIVLGGVPGIGKDSLIEPIKAAIGPWNFEEVQPMQLLGRFNSFVKSVILRVSEARDLGDVDRFAFYDHMKVLTAAPPDVLRCDEKHLREHAVLNVTGVIITTNYKTDGIYLPTDDRRHYVAWSERTMGDFSEQYWTRLWGWYGSGGIGHVVAYLRALDLSGFDPKAPPRKTAAFWDIADANRAPEDAELADAIDAAGRPKAITLRQIHDRAGDSFQEWLSDRRNRRQIPHRLEAAGYVPVRNDTATDGLWKIYGKRQAVYALRTLTPRDRIAAASAIARSDR